MKTRNWVGLVIGGLLAFIGLMGLKTEFTLSFAVFCGGMALVSYNFCLDSNGGENE